MTDRQLLLARIGRMSLTPGNMFANDNHVHHFGQWKRTYQPALFWGGVNNSYSRVSWRFPSL